MDMTKRMESLRERLFEIEYRELKTWYFEDSNILEEWPEIKDEPLVVRKAYAQKYVCERLPAEIKPDELIMGVPNMNSCGWGIVLPVYYTKEELARAALHDLTESSVYGHHPPDWSLTIKLGVTKVKQDIEEQLARFKAENADKEKIDNLRAMLIALDGITIFAKRYSIAAKEAADACADEERKRELLEMSAISARVPENPAGSFHEAAQAYWTTYSALSSGGAIIPLGRMDQFFYPYYKADTESGKLTGEQAADILASLLTKFNERVAQDTKQVVSRFNSGMFSLGKPPSEETVESRTNASGGFATHAMPWREDEDINSDSNFNYGQSSNNWLMNCMLAGVHTDGSDATTELSKLFIEIVHDMELLMPTLAARVHKDTPKDFIELLARVLRGGQGEPSIYNDETIIPGFVDFGIPLSEARDYANDGCWETLIPGKSCFSYSHVLNPRCLEWVFFRGVSQHNGEMEGVDTGDPLALKTFEDFYEAYKTQVNHYVDKLCQARVDNFQLSYMIAPDPLMSSLTHDCVQAGRDISQDGARYVFHLLLLTGLACTADSLMVMKKLVYEDKTISMEGMIEALACNWEGHDLLRARAVNRVAKFGNDDDEADALAARVLKDFENHVEMWRGRHEKIMFPCAVGTFENYAVLGRDIGAAPDGRYKADPLAPNFSPTPGYDRNGPTAVIESVVKSDLLRYHTGAPLDLAINSNEVTGAAGIERLSALIRTFCDLGGVILTITSTNTEDLIDAKVNPDNHRGLRVRMGGLSAYFISMSPAQQDNIIKRFK